MSLKWLANKYMFLYFNVKTGKNQHFQACFWSWRNVQNKLKKVSRVKLNIKLNINLHLSQSKFNKSFSRELDRITRVLKMSGFVFGNRLGSTTSAGKNVLWRDHHCGLALFFEKAFACQFCLVGSSVWMCDGTVVRYFPSTLEDPLILPYTFWGGSQRAWIFVWSLKAVSKLTWFRGARSKILGSPMNNEMLVTMNIQHSNQSVGVE